MELNKGHTRYLSVSKIDLDEHSLNPVVPNVEMNREYMGAPCEHPHSEGYPCDRIRTKGEPLYIQLRFGIRR